MIPAARRLALVLVALASLVSTVFAKPFESEFTNTVVLTDDQGEYPLGRHLMILEDPTQKLTIDDVRRPEYADKFVPSSKDVPGFGFSPSAYWVKVDIDRQTTQEAQWLLEFGYAPMQWVDVYALNSDSSTSVQHGGNGLKYSERPYHHHKHIFELKLETRKTTHLYVRVTGETSKTIPLRLFRADVFAQSSSHELSMFSIYAGIIISLVFYNLFIFITLRDPTYVYYVGFLCVSSAMILGTQGIIQPILAPEMPAVSQRLLPLAAGLFDLFVPLFTLKFLNIRVNAFLLYRLYVVMILVAVGVIFSVFLAPYHVSVRFGAAVAGIEALLAIFTGVVLVYRGHVVARYFLVAWLLLCVGGFAFVLRVFGLLPNNAFTEHAMMWGSAAEAILLSIALAARMRGMKEEKERAQQESIDNKQIALNTIQKYSVKLEAEVKARTNELVETQQKLIVSEKMAALGVFTAGMAHEINNPANFVSVGAQNAAVQITELREFVRDLLADDPDPEIVQAFESRFAKLKKSNNTITEGIFRIEKIVKQLRAENPEGDVGMQPADVVESLESAWRVLSPTVKTPIVLSIQLDARPQVSCMIAEINQVFMALLSNAAHAIEDAVADNGADYRGEIRLASHEADGKLVITVTDNGIGIPADKLDKVFDPFFTTKTVGRGAGLGLSMARDVVRKHGGTLEVESAEGEGATFRISLFVAAKS